jgi:hypothetical protein
MQPGGQPDEAQKQKRKKLILGITFGCLGLLALACGIGAFGVYQMWSSASQQAQEMEQMSEQFAGEFSKQMSRAQLTGALSTIQRKCRRNADLSSHFHPDVYSELKGQACDVDGKVVQAFGDQKRSSVESLAGTNAESKASELGFDPSKCYRFTSGGATVDGCSTDRGRFQIIDMANLSAVK